MANPQSKKGGTGVFDSRNLFYWVEFQKVKGVSQTVRLNIVGPVDLEKLQHQHSKNLC